MHAYKFNVGIGIALTSVSREYSTNCLNLACFFNADTRVPTAASETRCTREINA